MLTFVTVWTVFVEWDGSQSTMIRDSALTT